MRVGCAPSGWVKRACSPGSICRTPTLVLTSGSTTRPTEMGEDVFGHDIVLDVEHMRRWSPQIARHVTLAPIEGAMHDVILSRPSVRARAYDELGRWHEAYVAR
jgi:alpha-beta hydrolase superfamily lysophospholipase